MMNILEVNNLSYVEKEKKLLNNVTFKIEEEKIYSFIGRVGSGKSHLIKYLSGILEAKEGSIKYKGIDLKHIKKNQYRKNDIGIIFSQNNYIDDLKVKYNLGVALKLGGDKYTDEVVKDLLEKVGLTYECLEKFPQEMSELDKQRLAIAMILAKKSKIIITDEITNCLNEDETKILINKLIEIVREEKKTLIIFTMSNYVASKADVIYGMANGIVNYIK